MCQRAMPLQPQQRVVVNLLINTHFRFGMHFAPRCLKSTGDQSAMFRNLLFAGVAAASLSLVAGQPANAAALFICDLGSPEGICANHVNSPDPNITFSAN